MDLNPERNASGLLGDLFQHVVNDMKRMMPLWEEFIVKTSKLSVSLRSTVASLSSFLDTLQKIADIATGAKGATKEIGSGLTRLCLRHRNVETKLKAYSSGLLESMVGPMQERLEDWRKSVVLLDKEHSKDQKRSKQELRKLSTDVAALQNKVRKGKSEVQSQLDEAMRDIETKTFQLEEFEKSSLRNALVEERTRFCVFISCLKPVMDMEKSVLTELTHVEEVVDHLCMQAGDPSALPLTSEQVIMDIQETKNNWFCQTPPLSHNSSVQSLSSAQSSQSTDSSPTHKTNGNHEAKQTGLHNVHVPSNAVFSSTSDDSGFVSLDLFGHQSNNNIASKSEKWIPAARQRSWTGLTNSRPTQDPSLPPKSVFPTTHTGSIRVPGRKKCPDISMVDDLPFRVVSSGHAHSLPPTPNPYAVPSLICRTPATDKSHDGFFHQDHSEQPTAHGSQRMSVDVASIDPEAVTWSPSHQTFDDDDDTLNSILEGFNQNSSALLNFREQNETNKRVDCIDTDELTAAMQELEWTTAMLDIMDDSSLLSTARKESVQEEECQTFPSDNEPARNPSKPPLSSVGIHRRSSMQGGTRKPLPPIRRTSSMTGSQQLNCPGSSPEDPSPAHPPAPTTPVDNHQQQPPLSHRMLSMLTTVAQTDNAPTTAPKPSSETLPLEGSRRGNGRRIPRINRTPSQPFGKTVPDDDRFFPPAPSPVTQRERSRLPCRSLSETHADIIQTLNEQLSATTPMEKSPYPARLGSCGKFPNAGRVVRPSEATTAPPPRDLGQIPEGVTFYRGMMSVPGTQKPSPVRFPKKTV